MINVLVWISIIIQFKYICAKRESQIILFSSVSMSEATQLAQRLRSVK